MTSQPNYLIVQQRQSDLLGSAEQARLANGARSTRPASSLRRYLGGLFTARRLNAARSAAVAQHANPGLPQEYLSCDT